MIRQKEAAERIKELNETVYLTIGYRWKCPNTLDKQLTAEEAVEFITRFHYFYEIERKNGKLHLNAYTANDMF
jgi:hypothetical protein